MTIIEARKALGEKSSLYSDQEVAFLIQTMKTLASKCIDRYLENKEKANERTSSNLG